MPALTFLLPDWLNLIHTAAPNVNTVSLPRGNSLTAGQPWFFIWQAMVLAGYTFSRRWVRIHRLAAQPSALDSKTIPLSSSTPTVWPFITGILSGIGLWLAGAFLLSLLVPAANRQASQVLPTLHSATLIIAITVAPYAEESFFRGELLNRWQARLGETSFRAVDRCPLCFSSNTPSAVAARFPSRPGTGHSDSAHKPYPPRYSGSRALQCPHFSIGMVPGDLKSEYPSVELVSPRPYDRSVISRYSFFDSAHTLQNTILPIPSQLCEMLLPISA